MPGLVNTRTSSAMSAIIDKRTARSSVIKLRNSRAVSSCGCSYWGCEIILWAQMQNWSAPEEEGA